jgi:hypothetical protein
MVSNNIDAGTVSPTDFDKAKAAVDTVSPVPIIAASANDTAATSFSRISSRVDMTRPGASFILQLASFRTIDRAITALFQLKENNIEAHWNRVNLGEKGAWYRLYTGCFSTKDSAVKFKNDYGLDKSIVLFAPWSVLVAESDAQKSLEKIQSTLRNHQIDYFIQNTRDGGRKLFTGAFVTQKGAEIMAQEIMTLGYDAKVVLR